MEPEQKSIAHFDKNYTIVICKFKRYRILLNIKWCLLKINHIFFSQMSQQIPQFTNTAIHFKILPNMQSFFWLGNVKYTFNQHTRNTIRVKEKVFWTCAKEVSLLITVLTTSTTFHFMALIQNNYKSHFNVIKEAI